VSLPASRLENLVLRPLNYTPSEDSGDPPPSPEISPGGKGLAPPSLVSIFFLILGLSSFSLRPVEGRCPLLAIEVSVYLGLDSSQPRCLGIGLRALLLFPRRISLFSPWSVLLPPSGSGGFFPRGIWSLDSARTPPSFLRRNHLRCRALPPSLPPLSDPPLRGASLHSKKCSYLCFSPFLPFMVAGARPLD